MSTKATSRRERSTLCISSKSLPLLTMWRLMLWARRECRARRISVSELLAELRSKIDAQVLSEDRD